MTVCDTILAKAPSIFRTECHKHYLAPKERQRPVGGSGQPTPAHLVLVLLVAPFLLFAVARFRLAHLLAREGVHVDVWWIQVPGYLGRRYHSAPPSAQAAARRAFKLMRYSLWTCIAFAVLLAMVELAS